jgi:hypothetical protein
MSCEDCEMAQEQDIVTYFRWKNSNLELRGCRKHLNEVFEVLKKALAQNQDKEVEK